MEQAELLEYTLDVLNRLQIRYAIVGSFASGIWGESRQTQDIDIVVELADQHVDFLCEEFPSPEFYLSRPAALEAVALRRPFNVIYPATAQKIDFMVSTEQSWTVAQLDRRREVELTPSCTGFVAAPEDIILGKLVYYEEGGSDKHLRDCAGIMALSGSIVDRAYIARHCHLLGIHSLWQKVLEKID